APGRPDIDVDRMLERGVDDLGHVIVRALILHGRGRADSARPSATDQRFIGHGGLLLSGGMPARTWRQHAAMTSAAATTAAPGSGGARAGFSRVEIDNARRVPAPVDKAQEIGGRDRRRTVVFERVIIERI